MCACMCVGVTEKVEGLYPYPSLLRSPLSISTYPEACRPDMGPDRLSLKAEFEPSSLVSSNPFFQLPITSSSTWRR